jgi:DNA-binding transcriptional ArsR family regulator
MPTVGMPEAGPLLAALHDPSGETRVAVLEALTRLPLDRDCWMEVRRYVTWALEDRTAPEHVSAISPAARVPVTSVRAHLRRLAEAGETDERREAAIALAAVGDERAAEPLLALVDEPATADHAAKHLARLDLSAHVDAVRSRCAGSRSPEARFWLAVGLARTGEDAELVRFLHELAGQQLELPLLWGDPSLLVAELRRGPALPDTARAHVQDAASTAEGDARRLAEILLEPDEEQAEAPAEPPAPPAPVTTTEALRSEMRSALERRLEEEPTPGWQQAVESAVDEVATGSDRRAAWALAISELFRRMTERPSAASFLMGNEIVMLAHDVEGFVPDAEGLLDAYQPLAAQGTAGGVTAQLGWTAARGGITYLLTRLAPNFATPVERLAAAQLVAEAAGYASSDYPPIFGGAPPEPEPPVPTEMIDDMVSANGGGREGPTRGLPPAEEAPHVEALPEEPADSARWILARVSELEKPDQPLEIAFRAGGAHEVAVEIGPEQEGMLAATGGQTFDEAMGPTTDMEQLFVTFIPPPSVSPPQQGSIFLPPTGTSRPCTFSFELQDDLTSFEAQILVYHRNRIVQLALLKGPVVADPANAPAGSQIELELAVITPGTADLGYRERFDVALSRTSAGTTAVADDSLALFDNDRIDRVVPALIDILTKIVTSEAARRADLEDEDVVGHLRALAFQGRELQHAIAEPLTSQLGTAVRDRLQVLVEDACEFFPVEFVYDLPTPKSDAGLCPGWKAALRAGTCPEPHKTGPRGLAEHVCPIGFWALSKVIERQVVGNQSWTKMGLRGVEFAVRSHPTAERGSLEPPRAVLFAASSKVDDVRKGQIAGVRRALEKFADDAAYTETWDGWVEAVGSKNPSLLVLLSHTAEEQFQAALEVGAGDLCLISQIDGPYLRTSTDRSPIVLLLGCETAVSDFGLQTFVAKFQDLGAALVVGTVASVLGQRAAPVARTIATDFAAAAKRQTPISVGDLLLATRRKLLAKGELTALCLTAFGDANWQLGG